MRSRLDWKLLQQTEPDKPDSSFAEKAQTTARAAANKAKAEALKLKRSALLKDLGYKLRQHQAPDAILAPEIARAKAVQERIKLLDEEIQQLRHHSWIRHPTRGTRSRFSCALFLWAFSR